MTSDDRIVLAWNGGKDTALALATLRQYKASVHALLASVPESSDRIGRHGVPENLLQAQARAAGVPLRIVRLPESSTAETYETLFRHEAEALKAEGVERCAFGEFSLQDVRDARERQLRGTGLKAVFPLWGLDTKLLAENFVRQGFQAVVVTVDPRKLDPSFVGRDYDLSFIADLPVGVDPCGERGEFHTFVYAGPIFERPIAVERGGVAERDGLYCQDLSLI